MLMTFDPQGRVQFTRNPAALKLVEGLGKLSVTRMSEILFSEEHQKFYIRFVTGQFANLVLQWRPSTFHEGDIAQQECLTELWIDFWMEHSVGLCNEHINYVEQGGSDDYGPVLFDTYENAVAIEVGFIDMLRERGIAVQ